MKNKNVKEIKFIDVFNKELKKYGTVEEYEEIEHLLYQIDIFKQGEEKFQAIQRAIDCLNSLKRVNEYNFACAYTCLNKVSHIKFLVRIAYKRECDMLINKLIGIKKLKNSLNIELNEMKKREVVNIL